LKRSHTKEPRGKIPLALFFMQNLRLILVSPKYAGNVGAVARLAANFGVTDVWVVNPQCDLNDAEAKLYAVGKAKERLASFQLATTLTEAIGPCAFAVGLSGNTFDLKPQNLAYETLPAWALDHVSRGRIALVFGREDNGLSQEELLTLTHVLKIPTEDFQPSMNLSHAVAAVLAPLYACGLKKSAVAKTDAVVELSDVEALIGHFENVMRDGEIYQDSNPEKFLIRLKRLFLRAGLEKQELALLRAFLSKVQVQLGTRVRKKGNSKTRAE
jgi:TrmH family RNA methyltransferase